MGSRAAQKSWTLNKDDVSQLDREAGNEHTHTQLEEFWDLGKEKIGRNQVNQLIS